MDMQAIARDHGGTIATPVRQTFWDDFGRRPEDTCEPDDGRKKGLVNILVPIDLTNESFFAVDCAFRLAEGGTARVTLFHSIQLNLTPYGPANLDLIKQKLRQTAENGMRLFAEMARSGSVPIDYVIEEGKPHLAIEKFIKSNQVDLVILARRHSRRWFFARKTAEKVIRRAACPVLVLNHLETTHE